MILRIIAIIVSLASAAGLWFAFDQLGILRRTVFWEYRFITFGCGAFLALSLIEFVMGWIKQKLNGTVEKH